MKEKKKRPTFRLFLKELEKNFIPIENRDFWYSQYKMYFQGRRDGDMHDSTCPILSAMERS